MQAIQGFGPQVSPAVIGQDPQDQCGLYERKGIDAGAAEFAELIEVPDQAGGKSNESAVLPADFGADPEKKVKPHFII